MMGLISYFLPSPFENLPNISPPLIQAWSPTIGGANSLVTEQR